MSLPAPPSSATPANSSSMTSSLHAPPPPPGPSSTPPLARARLASILTETTQEVETWRSAYNEAQRRAKHFEDLANSLKVVSGSASEDQIRQHIQQLEQRTREAEMARDTETARRVAITEMWAQLRDYLETVEAHSRDARLGFDRIMQTGGGALQVLPPPKLNDHPSHRSYQPPPHPSQHHHHSSSRVRPRDDNGEGPPSKKSRLTGHPNQSLPPPHAYSQPSRQHRQRSPSRTPSDGSIDVDEMLLRTAENDGRQPQQHHRGQTYSSQHDNPYPHHSPGHPQHLAPAMSAYQTHVFAPVVTGAPVKKGASTPNPSSSNNNNGSKSFVDKPPSHSTFTVNPQPATLKTHSTNTNGSTQQTFAFSPPAIPIPSHNEEGHRLCRQCGQSGRYKDGKCVEKWGPGPLGPGTVCDRCRKKMKRVERRGTTESSLVHSGSFREEVPQGSLPPLQSLGRSDTMVSQSAVDSPAMRPMEPPHSLPLQKQPAPSTHVSKKSSRTPPMRSPPTSNSGASPRHQPPVTSSYRAEYAPRAASPAHTSNKSDLDADADADEDDLLESQTGGGGSQNWHDNARAKKISPRIAEPAGNGSPMKGGDVDMDILEAVDAAEAETS